MTLTDVTLTVSYTWHSNGLSTLVSETGDYVARNGDFVADFGTKSPVSGDKITGSNNEVA